MHLPLLRRRAAPFAALVIALATAGGRCTSDSAASHRPFGGMELPRNTAARLSVPVAYQPCTERAAPDAAVPRTHCRVDPAAARPPRAIGGAGVADSLHQEALTDLAWSGGADVAVARAIQNLRAAARLAPDPAPALADLAAVYVARAEATQSLRDLLEAVEAADSAVALAPRDPVALFNRALALDRLGLETEARAAWSRYLAADSTSAWGREAAARRDRLAAPAVLPSLPMDASPAAADSFAAAWPQTARELGWERVLDEWGAAVLAGDAGRAGARLALAERLGAGLARRGGDGTLAQAVAAIRGAPDADAVRRLAQAHRAYAAGQRAYVALNHAVAERELGRAESLGAASGTLVRWAAVFRGASLFYLKKPDASDSILSLAVAGADTAAAPALAARARWNHGTVLLRLGRYQRAQEEYRVASRLLHRLRETENVGAVDYCLGEAEFALGNEPAADSILMHGLSQLRGLRASRWLHTTLFVVGNLSTIRHLQRAEASLRAEDVAVAERNGEPMYRVEAGASRARLLARATRGAPADSLVKRIGGLVPLVADTIARPWALNDVRLAGAAAALHSPGPPPLAVLDSAVGFYASQKNPLLLIPALQTRAEARLAARDADGAVADLDSASTLLARLNTQITQTAARVAMLDRAGRLFDQLAMLRLAEKRENLAFAALERGRTTFAGRGRAAAASARGVRATSPSGEVVLSYALVGDTLLAWTLAGTTLQLERTTPGRARLLGTLERVRAALEDGGDEAAVRADLSELYEVLVRRVEGRLGERVVVVADGEIAPAPFAALFDARNGHYLVEDHQLRFAASLRDAVATGAAGAATAPAVLVADPAFSRRAFPLLGRLPAARAEVDSIARGFRGPTVLRDRGATSAALVEALPGAGLLHFAGHAVFDDDRPEQSYLLLAPSAADDGRLTAQRVESLRLPRMRLVVLAACSTLPGRSGRSGGFAGLSAALLGAGAQGVVGSLWDTDDRLTLPLMVAFHRAYARDRDGAAALREAQLALLHSGDRELASPAAWAGFRYAGR